METKNDMYKYKREYVWDCLNAGEREAAMAMGEDYKDF